MEQLYRVTDDKKESKRNNNTYYRNFDNTSRNPFSLLFQVDQLGDTIYLVYKDFQEKERKRLKSKEGKYITQKKKNGE